jgi:hypothetical protein
VTVNRIIKWVVVGAGVLFGLFVIGVIGVMAFVFSIGTAVVDLEVTATVFDRELQTPVGDCLLAFEKGFDGRPGYGRTSSPTDRDGHSKHESTHSYTGSMFWPFDRVRHPTVRFYIGEPPRYGSDDEVEMWDVRLRFEEPWTSGSEVVPAIELERALSHDESYVYKEGDAVREAVGSEPITTVTDRTLLKAVVQIDRSADRPRYRIPLSIYLDKSQIAACQRRG